MTEETIKIGLAIVSDSGTKKTLADLADVRRRINELKNEFKTGGKDVDTFTRELAELDKTAKKLDKSLDAIGETRRINLDSGQLEQVSDGLTAGQRITKAGAQLRNLPSTRIPGTTIGTDAIGNILRISGAAFDKIGVAATSAATKLGFVTAAETAAGEAAATAAPGLLASAAGFATVIAPIALFTAGVVAVGLAVKSAVDTVHENLDRLEKELNARRGAVEAAFSGTTLEEAQKKVDEYNETIKAQTKLLDENKAKLGESGQAAVDASNQFGVLSAGLKKGLGDNSEIGKFQAQVEESEGKLADAKAGLKEWQAAIDEGLFVTKNAAEAEKKLAEERTALVLDQAAAAGQEEAARRKALEASTEQNEKRLQSIEDERAAIAAQLNVLQSSGDTSEKVSDQISKLNGQLSSLGKESDFINKTALAASKARDAEKKTQKDAEDAAKKTAAAQQKYTDATKTAGRTFTQSSQDIKTKLKQGLADNLTSMLRDATDITEKYRRENVDLDIKASRDERDAAVEKFRNLEDIRDNALKSEQEAIREGDFKQLFLSRQAAQDALRDEQKADTREKQDRLRAISDQRNDLFTAQTRERSDRITAFERQNEDTRLAADRDFAQAKLTKQRSLAMSQEAYNAELKQFGAYLQARQQLQGQMLQPGKTTSTGATLPTGQFAVPVQAMFAQVLRK